MGDCGMSGDMGMGGRVGMAMVEGMLEERVFGSFLCAVLRAVARRPEGREDTGRARSCEALPEVEGRPRSKEERDWDGCRGRGPSLTLGLVYRA